MVVSQKRKGEDFEIPEAKRMSKEILSAHEAPDKSVSLAFLRNLKLHEISSPSQYYFTFS